MLVWSPVALLNCFSAGFNILSFAKRGALGGPLLNKLVFNVFMSNLLIIFSNKEPTLFECIFIVARVAAIMFLTERNASSSLSKSFPKHLHSMDLSFSSQSPLLFKLNVWILCGYTLGENFNSPCNRITRTLTIYFGLNCSILFSWDSYSVMGSQRLNLGERERSLV